MRWNIWHRGPPLVIAGFGAGIALYATRYDFGSLAQMGPGFFPIVLALALFVLSVATLLFERQTVDGVQIAWVPTLCILVSVLFFAWAVERWGLLLTTAICMMVLMSPYGDVRLARKLVVAALFSIGLSLLFGVALKINVALLPVRIY